MLPILLPLYGNLNINSYGVMIALGLGLCTLLMIRQKPAALSTDQISNAILAGIVGGILGGRIVFALTEPSAFESFADYFYLWIGGYSILGAVVGILLSVFVYCRFAGISYMLFMDLVAINAGLLQGFSRIGCFLAGCCQGIATSCALAFDGHHPAQLYSAATYFIIFFIAQCSKSYPLRPGIRIASYCVLVGIERFAWDFLRDDRIFWAHLPYFSINQWIALALILAASIVILILAWPTKQKGPYESF